MRLIIVRRIDVVDQTAPIVLAWSPSKCRFSHAPGLSFADGLNAAVTAAGRADVVLVAEGAAPEARDWTAKLSAAARASDLTAAASAISGGPASPPLHPRTTALSPVCCCLRRSALDLIGPFRERATPEAVLADWAVRALGAGLVCVLADELAVHPAAGRKRLAETEADTPLAAELSPLRRSLERAARAGSPITVTVDARALGPRSGGTQAYTAALVLAIADRDDLSVRAVVAHDAPPQTAEAFRSAGVEVIDYEQAVAGVPRTDLVHLPHQVFGTGDLNLARLLADRLVLTHLDLIAFHNPGYHASHAEWLTHRRITRIGMAAADTVVFTSEHARTDALAEELIGPDRCALAGIGVDPAASAQPQRRPAALGDDPGPFLLVLGANYAHKNRPFAIRLLAALRERHSFRGRLVLAGRHMERGSSAEQERELLAKDPELAGSVCDLGSVDEEEKAWLLAHATALVCPSVSEGYGLTPLEAAAFHLPCLYAAVTAHAEVLGHEAACLVPWDASASAALAAPLLGDGPARRAHLADMTSALERSGWVQVAAQLAGAYAQALRRPFRPAGLVAWEQLEREQAIADLDGHRRQLEDMVGNALSLAGQGGLLSAEQQLGLIRVAARPRLAGPLLAPFAFLGGLGRRG